MKDHTSTEQPEARDLAYWIAHTTDNPTAALIQSLHARVQELEAARKQGFFRRLTLEEAIRQSLTDDIRSAGAILAADFGATVRTQITFNYEAPANYAKAVLADFIKEKQG